MSETHPSIGEQRVRFSFNSAGEPNVTIIKRLTADLIDVVAAFKDKEPRLAVLAMTVYEEACMWAVKLVTTDGSATEREDENDEDSEDEESDPVVHTKDSNFPGSDQ